MPDELSDTSESIPADTRAQLEMYRRVVVDYEQTNAEIDALIMQNHGGTEAMSQADLATYRTLAARRDDLFNQMKALETRLLGEDS